MLPPLIRKANEILDERTFDWELHTFEFEALDIPPGFSDGALYSFISESLGGGFAVAYARSESSGRWNLLRVEGRWPLVWEFATDAIAGRYFSNVQSLLGFLAHPEVLPKKAWWPNKDALRLARISDRINGAWQ